MRVVTTVRGLAATEPHISLTSLIVVRYTTEDDLCSIKYFNGPHCILQRRGGTHTSHHDGEGPGRHRATNPCPLPKRGRRALSPITPCVPPGQWPHSRGGQEVVIYQSRGWHCRSFVIVAIRGQSVYCWPL